VCEKMTNNWSALVILFRLIYRDDKPLACPCFAWGGGLRPEQWTVIYMTVIIWFLILIFYQFKITSRYTMFLVTGPSKLLSHIALINPNFNYVSLCFMSLQAI
jgi:hypothetical protein